MLSTLTRSAIVLTATIFFALFLAISGATHSNAANPVGTACPAGAIHIKVNDSLANAVNNAPTNAIFCIESGVHRMQTAQPKSGQKFYSQSGAILNGSRLLTSFTRSGTLWVASGQTQTTITRGSCMKGYEACLRPLGFFINDVQLRQVTSLAGVKSGTFYFDQAAGKIYFADSPTGKKVEATATRYAIASSANNVLVDGIIVEKYYNPAQDGAVRGAGTGWVVQKCLMRYNSGGGAQVYSYGTIRNCNVHHNGQMGMTGGGTGVVIDSNVISYNNMYGFDPEWDAAGMKIGAGSNMTISNNKVVYNHGPGLWCDESCTNVTYEKNTVEYNDGPGIFYEISSKATIRNNTLRQNNQSGKGWYWGGEIQIAASEYSEIYGNKITVAAPGRSIMLIDQNRQKASGGYYRTQGNYVHNNDITYLGAGSAGGTGVSETTSANYGIIQNGGNKFNYNIYRYRAATVPDFIWGITELTWAGFRKAGQEANGSMVTY